MTCTRGSISCRGGAAAGVLVVLAASTLAVPQTPQLVRPEDALVALFGLQADVEVERRLLQREEANYDANLHQRLEIRDRLSRTYEDLEALFRQERGEEVPEARPDRDRPSEAEIRAGAEAKEDEARVLERQEAALRDEARTIRDQIRRLRARISMFNTQMETLRATLPRDRDSVTGIWDVTLMPSGDKGVFALWQTGTIVSGQYVLDGPFRGSLEGTLVNKQLLLRRIDARLGRSMELSGYVSEDGQTVQGTWTNYDLSSGRSPTGSWTAKKRASTPSESPSGSGETSP